MVGLATRLAAVEAGGNAVFGDLQPGDLFSFPKHPETVYVKAKSGWYYRHLIFTHPIGCGYRTGSGTAVVKVEVQQ